MSETNLPFEERFIINKQVTAGEKLKQEREKSLTNPKDFWAENQPKRMILEENYWDIIYVFTYICSLSHKLG